MEKLTKVKLRDGKIYQLGPDELSPATENNLGGIKTSEDIEVDAAGVARINSQIKTNINNKVDKIDGKGLSTNDFTNEDKQALGNKVDKIPGKGLTTNDYTDAEKDKLQDVKNRVDNLYVEEELTGNGTDFVVPEDIVQTVKLNSFTGGESRKSKNLIKTEIYASQTGHATVTPITNGYKIEKAKADNYSRGYIILKPNSLGTFKFRIKQQSNVAVSQLRIYLYKNEVQIGKLWEDTTPIKDIVIDDLSAEWILWIYPDFSKAGNIGDYVEITDIMISKDIIPYEPYYAGIKSSTIKNVESWSPNRANPNDFIFSPANAATWEVFGNGVKVIKQSISESAFIFMDFNPFVKNTNPFWLTCKINPNKISQRPRIILFKNGSFCQDIYNAVDGPEFRQINTIDDISAKWQLGLYVDTRQGITGDFTTFTDFMISSEKLPYIPYEENDSTIDFNQTLRGVDSARDELKIIQNEKGLYDVKRINRVKEVDMGNLDWWKGSINARPVFRCKLDDTKTEHNYKFICSKYEISEDKLDKTISSSTYLGLTTNLYFFDSTYDNLTAEEVKQNLIGSKIIYELKTPTEETIFTDLTFSDISLLTHAGGTIKITDNEIPVDYIFDTYKPDNNLVLENRDNIRELTNAVTKADNKILTLETTSANLVTKVDNLYNDTSEKIINSELKSIKKIPNYILPNMTIENFSGMTTKIRNPKNLIPFPYIQSTKTENGATFTINADGSIRVSGSPTQLTVFKLCDLTLTKGTYFLSGCPKGGQVGSSYFIDTGFMTFDEGTGKKFEIKDSNKAGYVTIYIYPATNINLIFYPMIIIGDKEEPYYSLQDNSISEIRISSKNKANPVNNLEAYIDANNTIVQNSINRVIYCECKPNTDYTISFPKTSAAFITAGSSANLPIIGSALTGVKSFGGGDKDTILYTTSSTAAYLCFRYRLSESSSTADLENALKQIQIEEGNIKTDFTSFNQDIKTYTIPQKILELPDYGKGADLVGNEIDLVNNKYIKKMDLIDLGSINWVASTEADTWGSATIPNLKMQPNESIAGNAISVYLDVVPNINLRRHNSFSLSIRNNANAFRVYSETFIGLNAEQVKERLKGIKVWYEVETPEIIPLPVDIRNIFKVKYGEQLEFVTKDNIPNTISFLTDPQANPILVNKQNIEKLEDITSSQSYEIISATNKVDNLYTSEGEITKNSEPVTLKEIIPNQLPNVRVDSFGGKTIIRNQLCNLKAGFQSFGITGIFNKERGTVSLNGKATTSGYFGITETTVNFIANHKYFLCGGNTIKYENKTIYVGQFKPDIIILQDILGNGVIATATGNGSLPLWINIVEGYEFKNEVFTPQLVDLTEMFGEGNEPTDITDERIIKLKNNPIPFAEKYFEKDRITSIETHKKTINLFDYDNPKVGATDSTANNYKIKFENNYLIGGGASGISAGQFVYVEINSADAFISFDCDNDDLKYDIRGFNKITNGIIDGESQVLYRVGALILPAIRIPVHFNKKYKYISIATYGEKAYDSPIKNLFIKSGSEFNDYLPYWFTNSYKVPKYFLDNLKYGVGFGNKFNYIDLKNNKFVQWVDEVDLYSLRWIEANKSLGSFAAKLPLTKKFYYTGICTKYPQDTDSGTWDLDKTWNSSGRTGDDWNFIINDLDYLNFTVAQFKEAMRGVKLQYELETPIEIELASSMQDYFDLKAGDFIEFIDEWGYKDIINTISFTYDSTKNPILVNKLNIERIDGLSQTNKSDIEQLSHGVVTPNTGEKPTEILEDVVIDNKIYSVNGSTVQLSDEITEDGPTLKSIKFNDIDNWNLNYVENKGNDRTIRIEGSEDVIINGQSFNELKRQVKVIYGDNVHFEEDNTTKYIKDVPANALGFASIENYCGNSRKTNNLMPYPYADTSHTVAGVTWTVNEDAGITISGTPDNYSSFTLMDSSVLGINKLYLSLGVKGALNEHNLSINVPCWDKDDTLIDAIIDIKLDYLTITFPENIVKFKIIIKRRTNGLLINETIYPMLSTEILPYEKPFEGIHNAKVTEINTVGQNLIPYPYSFESGLELNGVTFTINDDGSITANGTASQKISLKIMNPIPIPDKTINYYISGCPDDGSYESYWLTAWGDNQALVDDIGSGTGVYNIAKYKDIYVTIEVKAGTVLNNVIFKPLLSKYIKDKPVFTPRTLNEHILIPQEIQNLPDYGLGINGVFNEIDIINKKYYHRVKEVDLGDIHYSATRYGFYSSSIKDIKGTQGHDDFANILCTKYIVDTSNNIVGSKVECAIGVTPKKQIVIRDTNSGITDATEFETYIKGEKLIYELETPEIIDISNIELDDVIQVYPEGQLKFVNNDELELSSKVIYEVKK